ncbi:MAG: PepSY domain-containing protein [Pseudomonas sp.]
MAVLFFFLLCFSAHARDLDQNEALMLRQQGTVRPLEELIGLALERYPGARLLETELKEKKGSYLYEIEILTVEGVVRELKFDARNSRLLKDKEDD